MIIESLQWNNSFQNLDKLSDQELLDLIEKSNIILNSRKKLNLPTQINQINLTKELGSNLLEDNLTNYFPYINKVDPKVANNLRIRFDSLKDSEKRWKYNQDFKAEFLEKWNDYFSKWFTIYSAWKTIPWEFIIPFEKNYYFNHNQSLFALNRRKWLTPFEIFSWWIDNLDIIKLEDKIKRQIWEIVEAKDNEAANKIIDEVLDKLIKSF